MLRLIPKIIITIILVLASYLSKAQNDSLSKVPKLLELSLEDLMNIEVVTASRFEQKISEAPSTMIVITAQQIQERGYEELDDALRDIAGIDLIHAGGGFPVIRTFRGMYGDENRRILLMIDGIVVNSIMGSAEMGGPAYSLHNALRVEIIWGPGSALYGANAYSGVINIITKKGENMNRLYFQRGFGNFNTSFEKLMVGVKKENIDVSFSGSLFRTNGPAYTNRHPRYTNSYVDNARSFDGQIGYTIKRFKTTLGFKTFENPFGLGLLFISPTKLLGFPPQGNSNTGNLGMVQGNIRGEKPSLWSPFSRVVFIQSEFAIHSRFSVFSRVQFRETGLSDKSYTYQTIDGQTVSRAIRTHYSRRIEAEVATNYTHSDQHLFSTGIQFYRDNLELNYRGTNPDNRTDTIDFIPVTNLYATFKPRQHTIQNNVGTYIQYTLNTKLFKKTNFTIGTRYDHNSVYGSTFNPRIGIINQPDEKLTFKFLFGSAYRAPTNFELYSTVPIRIPNPDLKPEKITTYEINFIYKPSRFYLAQVNLFQNDLSDIIIQDVPIGNGLIQNQNLGSASIHGLETSLDIMTSKTFSAFLNFTFQKGKQNNGTKKTDIPNIAEVKGNLGFTFHVADLVSFNLISNWVGSRSVPATNPLGKVKGYFITNFVISTNKLFDNRVGTSLNIRNLFDQTYRDPGVRAADGNFYATVLEQPGINGVFKVSVALF